MIDRDLEIAYECRANYLDKQLVDGILTERQHAAAIKALDEEFAPLFARSSGVVAKSGEDET